MKLVAFYPYSPHRLAIDCILHAIASTLGTKLRILIPHRPLYYPFMVALIIVLANFAFVLSRHF